jgi:hypothetical protein
VLPAQAKGFHAPEQPCRPGSPGMMHVGFQQGAGTCFRALRTRALTIRRPRRLRRTCAEALVPLIAYARPVVNPALTCGAEENDDGPTAGFW